MIKDLIKLQEELIDLRSFLYIRYQVSVNSHADTKIQKMIELNSSIIHSILPKKEENKNG
jgi:hypothetical protein